MDSHELGNLLFVIEASGELLVETFDETDPRRQFVNKIILAGKRAKDLVQELQARGFDGPRDPRSGSHDLDGTLDAPTSSRPAPGSDYVHPSESRAAASRSRAGLREARDAQLKTILVVEDEGAVRELVSRMLSDEGYRVLQAGSGKEAMNIFDRDEDPIDLVITDVVMPQMSGTELLTEVRGRREGLKVLYMSGHSEEVINNHGAVDLVANYLPKPFTRRQLLSRVREVLNAPEEQG